MAYIGNSVVGVEHPSTSALNATTGAFTGAVTADAGVVVDNITIDGTEIDLSSGDLTIDVTGELILDTDLQGEGNGILLKDDGTTYGNIFRTGSDLVIMSSASDEDLIFKGNDGGSTITALTLDMSAAGAAAFNAGATFANGCTIVGGDFGTLLLDNADASHGTQLLFQHNSTVNTGADIQMSDAGGLKIRTLAVEPITLHVSASAGSPQEVIRFHTDKKLSYGRTSTIAGSHFAFEYDSSNGVGINLSSTDASGSTHNQIIFTRNDSTVGTISTTGSNTAYGTSSDYRLKENVNYTWDATSRLKQLKPARFNFIIDADTTVDGFLAHEVSGIVPESVIGTKDETRNVTNAVLSSSGKVLDENITQDNWTAGKLATTDAEGNTVNAIYPSDSTWTASHTEPVIQSIDQSKLVPLLVKSLQEAVIKIETLEAKVTALENA